MPPREITLVSLLFGTTRLLFIVMRSLCAVGCGWSAQPWPKERHKATDEVPNKAHHGKQGSFSLEALRALRNVTKATVPFIGRYWIGFCWQRYPSRKPDVCQWGPAGYSQLGSCGGLAISNGLYKTSQQNAFRDLDMVFEGLTLCLYSTTAWAGRSG